MTEAVKLVKEMYVAGRKRWLDARYGVSEEDVGDRVKRRTRVADHK